MGSPEFYEQQAGRVAEWKARLVAAALAAARVGWPGDSSLPADLQAHADAPGDWSRLHWDWVGMRWGLDDCAELDWDTVDFNPWSYLQDCLGIRGLAAVVNKEDPPVVVANALRKSSFGPTTDGPIHEVLAEHEPGQPAMCFLKQLPAWLQTQEGLQLVRLIDTWSESELVACVRSDVVDRLSALAKEADNDGRGLEVV